MPMYINLVREPVARFVSGYYYKRFENPVPMSNEDRNRTIDECVFGNNWEVFAIFLFFFNYFVFFFSIVFNVNMTQSSFLKFTQYDIGQTIYAMIAF